MTPPSTSWLASPPAATRPPATPAREHYLVSPLAAVVVLFVFWLTMMASLRDKAVSFDEPGFAAAGYSHWKYNDYRLDPPNGNLPHRLIALPLLAGDTHPFPSLDSADWRIPDESRLGDTWFNHSGRNLAGMLARGHAGMGLVAVALGGLTWWCSRRWFGAIGGMLSLGMYVLCPTILANGALMTADTTAAFFFLASALAIGAVLQEVSFLHLFASILAVSGLFLSKMSAVLIIPVATILVAIRLADGRPLPVILGARRIVVSRIGQLSILCVVASVHLVGAWGAVWWAHGFRHEAFAPGIPGGRFLQPWEYILDKPAPVVPVGQLGLDPDQETKAKALPGGASLFFNHWSYEALDTLFALRQDVLRPGQAARLDELRAQPPPRFVGRVLAYCLHHRLFPETFLFGYAQVWLFSESRPAFLNGQVQVNGWRTFFPYTFLVKTPLPFLALLAVAAIVAAFHWRTDGKRLLYTTLPAWTLIGVYWAAAISSQINIGHRHLVPIYAPLCLLAGWAATATRTSTLSRGTTSRPSGRSFILALLLVLLLGDVAYRFPNYIAYFNGIVSPRQAYRHLVDSSLDWGQELPAVKKYLDEHRPSGATYFSYFGNGSPAYYGIRAQPLFSLPGRGIDVSLLMGKDVPASGGEAALDELRRAWPTYELVGVSEEATRWSALLLKKASQLRLTGGTYLVSATMLQPLYYQPWSGPWNDAYEKDYQGLRASIQPMLSDNPNVRMAALQGHELSQWQLVWRRFEEIRFARLTAFLRPREPHDQINHAILVYRLTDQDVAQALEGPPPVGQGL